MAFHFMLTVLSCLIKWATFYDQTCNEHGEFNAKMRETRRKKTKRFSRIFIMLSLFFHFKCLCS